jgi:porin
MNDHIGFVKATVLGGLVVVFVAVLALLLSAGVVSAQDAEKPERVGKSGYKGKAGLGGPTSTEAQLEEADELKDPAFRFPWFDEHLQPWFDWKAGLNEDYGLQLGLAYTYLHQWASDVPDGAEDEAGLGIVRLIGRWELLGRGTENTGTLVFSGDNRHRTTDVAPGDLGFEAGYLGIPGTLFSDVDTVLVDFHWQQRLNEGDSGIVAGRYDPNDFLDVLGYANPWTSFQNLSILFDTSIALADASMGIGGGHWLSDQVYALATLNDANGVVGDVGFFEDGSEFYKAAEIGWTPSKDQRYFNKIHVHGWHADKREDAGVDESWGVSVAANKTVGMRWMTFVKAGMSDGEAPLYESSVTVGAIHYIAARSDLVGLGVNWGDPADETLDEQVTSELFYRLQLAQNFAITPSIQLVLDPALNPEEDELWIAGLRARLTL